MTLSRSILSTVLTGASGAGGTLIYHHAIPGTGTEVLIKDGCYLLNEENEYKAVTFEHQDILLKNKDSLKLQNPKDTNAYLQVKNGCKTELQTTYKRDFKFKDNLINLCTHNGIITVKARLMANGQNKFIVDETDEDTHYRRVFVIYRYYQRFIDGVKKHNKQDLKGEELKIGSKVDTGRQALNSACTTELKRPHREIKDSNYFQDISWWCQKLPYESVKDLIKFKDPDGELDTEATGKANIWKHTPKVQEVIRTDKEDNKSKEDLTDKEIKNGCCNVGYNKDLSINDSYTSAYVVVKHVCKKEN